MPEDKLTSAELRFLRSLSTVKPTKPELPKDVAARFVDLGLAISLVEGGLQLTDLGRERLQET
jgi:hypothetical protein